ncbi:major capsid protein [Flyfo microvirus Tbat2_151]|nr:major capsid protein [Flyfo microvirus Tbat2_151]
MKRSKHSLSHYKLLSLDMGELVPVGLIEVLPGDTMQQATSALIRVSPLLAPVMHPVHVRIHHWFVPHRIIWDDWEDFITGGPDGMDVSEFPTITVSQPDSLFAVGSLADYLGIPVQDDINGIEVSALPFRAYQLIYNEWYRDQDLSSEVPISTESGPDTTTGKDLRHIAWEKDYFTSSRPWEQKGPAITIPLGDNAPVVSTGQVPRFSTQGGSPLSNVNLRYSNQGGTAALRLQDGMPTDTSANAFFGNQTGLEADLTGVSAVTVNVLREAMALQRYEEARARYGSRYVEYLRYLQVRSSDARLQRPEYLGGGKQTIQFSEVLQTAEGDNPVGEMRGHGIGAMRSNRYRRFFEEHGYVVSLMSVRPKTIYANSLPRTWNRRTKEDFWQKELQHIGQQEVLNKEVYAAHTDPDGVFGFQDRYDEYRRSESAVAGEFRTSLLDFWHMARNFAGDVALNGSFVESNPTERIFAVPSQDTLYAMVNHSIQARRLVAKTGRSFIF